MATRLYYGYSAVPTVSPAFDGSWEATGSAVRRWLVNKKDPTNVAALESLAVATTLNSPAGAVDVLIAQYVSSPLSGAQTISGAIKSIIRAQESNAAADMRAQCVIWVMKSDGTSRGTLIATDTSALSNEFNTSLRDIKYPKGWTGSGTTPTSVAAQDGDRIVVELGYRKHENATTSRTGTLSLGNPEGTDCPEDETTTTANTPWIEFADTLTFQGNTDRVSQTALLVANQPTPSVRVSQTALLVANQPTPAARVSQTALLVAVGAGIGARVSQTVLLVAVKPPGTGKSWARIID